MPYSRSNSAVRDICAMFEKNDSTTTALRAKSPAGSVISNGEGQILHKVRSTFVFVDQQSLQIPTQGLPIEANGIGTNPKTGGEGSFSSSVQHQFAVIAGDEAEGSSDALEHNGLTPAELAAVEAAFEGEPETTPIGLTALENKMDSRVDSVLNGVNDLSIGSEEMPGDNPDKMTSGVQDTEAVMKPSDPKDEEAVSGGAALQSPVEPLFGDPISANTQRRSPAARKAPSKSPEKEVGRINSLATKNGANPGGAAKLPSFNWRPSPTMSKPGPNASPAVSAVRNTSPKKDSSSPRPASASKPPVTPTKNVSMQSQATPTSVGGDAATDGTPSTSTDAAAPYGSSSPLSTRSANKPSDTITRRTSLTAPTAASLSRISKPRISSTSVTSNATKKPARTSPTVKPRPKSPTRSVRLSSHLTAPTASSAAKHSPPSGPPTANAAAASTSIARKPSTIHRDRAAAPRAAAPSAPHAAKQPTRASLTKQNGVKRPDSRTGTAAAAAPTRKEPTRPAGQSFLDRMTRPTASSSSKAHEKLETVTGKVREGT